MSIHKMTAAVAVTAALGLSLAACGSSDPTVGQEVRSPTRSRSARPTSPRTEIIAEIYAQALEAKGVKVKKKLNIGAREAYIPALKNGEIDLLPEYSGNLLTYLDPKATATTEDDIEEALDDALPDNLEVLDAAEGRGQGLAQRHAGVRRQEQPQDDRRPQERQGPQARRQPGVQDPRLRHPGSREGLRHHRRQVHADQRRWRTRDAQGAARRQGRCRRHLLDDAVDPGQQARDAGGSQEPHRRAAGHPADQRQEGVATRSRRSSTTSRRS